MNERLKQEYEKYCDNFGFPSDLGIAKHFYNLALEDMKKEIEKYYRYHTYSTLPDIITIIDNLQ